MTKKQPEPNESSSQTDLTFEQAMKIIAQTPKKTVDEKIKRATNKTKQKKSK